MFSEDEPDAVGREDLRQLRSGVVVRFVDDNARDGTPVPEVQLPSHIPANVGHQNRAPAASVHRRRHRDVVGAGRTLDRTPEFAQFAERLKRPVGLAQRLGIRIEERRIQPHPDVGVVDLGVVHR